MPDSLLLTFNPGSSSVKIGVFKVTAGAPVRIGLGTLDLRHQPLQLKLTSAGNDTVIPLKAGMTDDLREVLDETLDWFSTHFPMDTLTSVGHRVVHGGDRFKGPAAIDDATLDAIVRLVPLAPMHQPQSVRLIQGIRHLRPQLAQCASFDTAFHGTQTDLVRRMALPRALFDQGIKRYGFHGLSYQYISGELGRQYPHLAEGKVIVAHLGSGASLCALQGRVSRDTSMGFSVLDGIPMATRCGALDPGVILHLLEQGRDRRDITDLLYKKSGLLGVSGISADSRELLASDRPEAHEALELFAFRTAGETARLATTLGGIDSLVFTAGIGAHQPPVRAAICEHLAWLGVELDAGANEANLPVISSAGSHVTVLVLATDEEQVIANEAVAILHPAA